MGEVKSSHFGNKYILLDLIGVGGMAEVYRCKLVGKKGFEKIIVVKKLLDQATLDKETVLNFIDEAKLAALLHHENIAQIYDFGEIEGSYFIAMEYLFGKDLHTIMQRAKELGSVVELNTALLIASGICAGMEYAHTFKDLEQKPLNIIHRDLSPHNVFITYDGKVKIIDFGVAKAELFDHRTQVGVIKGKVSYMAPEQLTEVDIDHRSDIYTIGILLYEMLSGKKMYIGDTATLIRKCMQGKYQKLEDICSGLPRQIYSLLDRALQFDREKRYSSCAEMRMDIEVYLNSVVNSGGRAGGGDVLKEYMLNLFAEDYENEKSKLYSTTKKFDRIYDSESEEKTRILSYKDNSHGAKLLIDASNTLTVVMDASGKLPDQSGKHRFFQSFLITPPRKALLVLLLVTSALILSQGILREKKEDFVIDLLAVGAGYSQKQEMDEQEGEKNGFVPDAEKDHGGESDDVMQEKLESLLLLADDALANSAESKQGLERAAHYYTQILGVKGFTEAAKNGLDSVSMKYADIAERELQENDILAAQNSVLSGLTHAPEKGRLLALFNLIEQEKIRIIEQLEWKAQRAMARNDLTTPTDRCAYKYYHEILKIDKTSDLALGGMRTIADRYAVLAKKTFRSFNLEKSREYVAKGLNVVPRHSELLEIKRDLARSKAGIFFRVVKKNIDEIAN